MIVLHGAGRNYVEQLHCVVRELLLLVSLCMSQTSAKCVELMPKPLLDTVSVLQMWPGSSTQQGYSRCTPQQTSWYQQTVYRLWQ